MTAMAAIFKPDRAHVLADSATCKLGNGRLHYFEMKIVRIKDIDAVVVIRGVRTCYHSFEMACRETEFDSFDTLLDQLPAMIEHFGLSMFGLEGEVMLVGYSDARQKPVAVFLYDHDRGIEGLERGKLYFFDQGVVSFGFPPGAFPDAESFDVDQHAIPAFEAARQEPFDVSYGCNSGRRTMAHGIGGNVAHVELGRDFLRGDIVAQWPDRIGEKINPLEQAERRSEALVV